MVELRISDNEPDIGTVVIDAFFPPGNIISVQRLLVIYTGRGYIDFNPIFTEPQSDIHPTFLYQYQLKSSYL